MPRFIVDGDAITFDDGGMNLLSSAALRELRDVVAAHRRPRLLFRMTRAAGADMNEMARFTPLQAADFARLGQETFAAIERLPCLTVAMIDGDCFGGALDLVMAFDLRLATARSRFSHPGAKLGIVTGFGGTSRWRRVIDPAAARRLFLTNEILSAEDAHAIGLINSLIGGLGEPELPQLDPATVRFVKELTIHGERLGQRDLVLLSERLGQFYF
jgi:enoyl-CoA hydratase